MEELNYHLIEKPEDVAAACEELSRSGEVGFDTETTSLSPFEGRVRLVQLASEESVSVFDLDRLAPDGEAARAESLEPLRRLLAATREFFARRGHVFRLLDQTMVEFLHPCFALKPAANTLRCGKSV